MPGGIVRVIGALAATVAIACAVALGLAALDLGGGGDGGSAPPERIVARGGGGASKPPPRQGARRAPARAVPSSWRRPAAGPAFAIARVHEGARVRIWQRPGRGPVAAVGPRTEFGSRTTFSVVRTAPGWLGVATPDLPNGELGWIRRDPRTVRVYWTKYSLHVELASRHLSLDYGGRRVGRFPVTIGAAGTGTPLGRFGVTDALSFEESPAYGCCAFALSGRQPRLPSDWTGGDRLAIHGTAGPVGGAESHGCIRATDETMRLLFRRVPVGAPVFVES